MFPNYDTKGAQIKLNVFPPLCIYDSVKEVNVSWSLMNYEVITK